MLLRAPVNLLCTLLLSAVFNWLLFLLRPDNNLSSIAAALFSAAGTIVALALPAAELGGNSVIRTAEYWLERAQTETEPERLRNGLHFIDKVKVGAITARRGSLYVLISFLLSAFALLTPRIPWDPQRSFRLDYLLMGGAAGFLLFGAVLFFPFAWAVYRLNDLQDTRDFISGLVGELSRRRDEARQAELNAAARPAADKGAPAAGTLPLKK